MPDFSVFDRYKPLVDNWPLFTQTLAQPLPTCIWANTLKIGPEGLATLLAAEKIPFRRLGWAADVFELDADFSPGYHWAFLAGLYHVQEAVSILPVHFLDVQPGHRILDMCAAPGNKSAQIAVAMNNTGTVIANDVNFKRMRAARQIFERLGVVNITTTNYDASNFPKAAGWFDRVLVDVPCSCEGTSRKDTKVLELFTPEKANRQSSTQQAMLRKAVQLCKPGGRIVYSTCTYAPEENEMVVDAILQTFGADALRLVPAKIDGLTASDGLTEWEGRTFDPSLRHALRIWPHQNNTGGFFIAVLEKTAETIGTPDFVPPPISERWAYPALAAKITAAAEDRFGLNPALLADYRLYSRNAARGYAVNPDHRPPAKPNPEATGLVFFKTKMKHPKLSTSAAMAVGSYALKNVIELTPQQVTDYINRQELHVSQAQTQLCTDMGYVLLRHCGYALGIGLYWPDDSGQGGRVQSMFPKGWSPTQ